MANIENSQISINVVGDDCLIILDRTCLESFRTFFFSAYRLIGKDEVKMRRVQGLGQAVKEILVDDNRFTFLSKMGYVNAH